MEQITQRIARLIKDKGLTNAAFADAIGIKRPIISHILSGRNKPSLHVVLQVLETFEDVDPSWLLLGRQNSPEPVKGPQQELLLDEEKTETEDLQDMQSDNTSSDAEQLPSTLLLIEDDEFRVIRLKRS